MKKLLDERAPRRAKPNMVHVTNLFGKNTRQALVFLRVKDAAVQLSPKEARGLAVWLFEVAEAAEQDAFIFDFIGDIMGEQGENAQSGVLLAFREFRKQYAGSHLEEGKDVV
jgi:hypothetical protein